MKKLLVFEGNSMRNALVAGGMLLVGSVLGFFLVVQSKAQELPGELIEGEMSPGITLPIARKGPTQLGVKVGYPVTSVETTILQTVNTMAYETILSQILQSTLQQIQDVCGFDTLGETIDHIETSLDQGVGPIEILDAWCMTDQLSQRYSYQDPLLATKLSLIRLIARDHAGSYENITRAMRDIPLESRFEDASQWGSWREVIYYAEYNGLLERVETDSLHPLHALTSQETENFFGKGYEGDNFALHELYQYWIDYTPELNHIVLYHPDNQKILRALVRAMRKSSVSNEKALIQKVISSLSSDVEVYEILKQWLQGLINPAG